MRRDQIGKFHVGNLKIVIDNDSNKFINNKKFKGNKSLFELLTPTRFSAVE
jgi:hypothetical protein